MKIILLVLVLCLSLIVLYFYIDRRKLYRDIDYMTNKLIKIHEDGSKEQVKVFTEKEILQNLLIEINRILQSTHEVKAEGERNEVAFKRMFSNISHDLRTPLTVIIGYIETMTLAKEISIEEQTLLLGLLETKTNGLIHLINNFFDLAKLDSRDMTIPLEKLMVNEICRQNILGYYEQIKDKNIEVELNIPETPLYCCVNEEALNRILDNLISNAIKYGIDGKVVGLDVHANESHVFIDVWDRGNGIDKKYHNDVFERLFTLEDSRNKYYQGSGLGLAITKQLTESMDGKVSLKSTPNKKTTFTLEFKKC